MDDQEKVQQNMISNLPLLFANGYPTSLEKITESQLENFIPFMVQCSLGYINLPKKTVCSEPEWWPEDLPFTIPLKKPNNFIGNWIDKMKEIVVICYQFHKSVFLLRFCNELASYEQASLRFINNYNSTTSLYDRRSNKLLVTFRNENMSYDQQQRTRKCLLQQKTNNGFHKKDDLNNMMVEPAPFDIYLCDNCDAELYSKDAIMDHEKTCNIEDIILCDSPEPEIETCARTESDELCKAFLSNFSLQPSSLSVQLPISNQTSLAKQEEASQRINRFSRRNRAAHSITRCPSIPLSSPAGMQLIRTTKISINGEYLTERLDRVERFCITPILPKSTSKAKQSEKRTGLNNIQYTFKRPADYSSHMFVFPRRQCYQRRHTAQHFKFLNSLLIKQCRPIAVRLKKLAEHFDTYNRTETTNSKLNIRLTRDTSQNSNWRISPSSEIIVDTIDLCSSDEDELFAAQLPQKPPQNKSNNSAKVFCSANTLNSLIDRVASSTKISNEVDGNRILLKNMNIMFPPAITITTNSNEDKSLKALRQSVYIFSNYKTNSAVNRCSNNPVPNPATVMRLENNAECNQENCSLSKNLISVADLCNGHRDVIKNVTHDINYENTSRVQPFTSPARVTSIDLTT